MGYKFHFACLQSMDSCSHWEVCGMIDPVISMNKCAGLNQSCIIHEQPKWLLKMLPSHQDSGLFTNCLL